MRAFLLVSFLFASSFVLGQKSFFGFEAGASIATQRNVGSMFYYFNTSSSQITFHQYIVKPALSVFYQFEFSDKIAARVKASYVAFGFKDDSQSTVISFQSLDINYFMVPITLWYKPTQHLSLGAGPFISFTAGGTHLFNQTITSTYHQNDHGFTLSGEHEVYKNFALGVTYIVGLKNIWLDDQGGRFNVFNRVLQVSLIYKLKKEINN